MVKVKILGSKSIANKGNANSTNFKYTLFLCSFEKKRKAKNNPNTKVAMITKNAELIYLRFNKLL